MFSFRFSTVDEANKTNILSEYVESVSDKSLDGESAEEELDEEEEENEEQAGSSVNEF